MDEYRRIHGVSSIWPAALFCVTAERGNTLLQQGFTLGILVTPDDHLVIEGQVISA
jgi:hypothetical protein